MNAEAAPAAMPTTTTALGSALARLEQFSHDRENPGNAIRVAELAGKLRSQTFNLVVFGEFKRGKTTFINALIGDELLPSAVIPITSVVTILAYAPRETISVEYLDGRVEGIARQHLTEFVTEQGNPENRRGVALVRVGVPADLLANGMQLVDTPGVGSVYDHNTEAARNFLPHVDGAILLVASDPPISRGECEFLREMRLHVARLFVVQNKIDQLEPEDRKVSVEFTRGVLRQVLGHDDITVFTMSAREGLRAKQSGDAETLLHSGLPAFEKELRRFQEQEQVTALLTSIVRNALEVAEDESLGLQLERQALHMTLEEIETRSAEFRKRRDEVLQQRKDDANLVRAEAKTLVAQTLQSHYETELRDGPTELRAALALWAEQQEGAGPAELLQRANGFIAATLHELLARWRQEEEAALTQALAGALQRFTDRANATLGRIYDMAREIFDLPPRNVETVGYLSAPSRFLWREWDWEVRPGLSGSVMLRLLPGARTRALKMAEERMLREHSLGCGRLRSDFESRAQAAVGDFLRELSRGLADAVNGIDRAIERTLALKRRAETETTDAEDRIAASERDLAAVIDDLRAALPGGDEARA
jgi:GTPase Era involved in 16S rRNA processing